MIRRILLAHVLALLLAIIGFAAAAPAGAAPNVYWGAYLGDQFEGAEPPYNMRGADGFESVVGKRMSLLEFSLPWAKCYTQPCDFIPFPGSLMEATRQRGYIPVYTWASFAQPLSSSQPQFQLQDIANGAYDDFVGRWAQDARDWGHPFFLRFNVEMNICGLWPYSECRNGNQPGDYVRAWRHVHGIFEAQGATNVNWVWCPNIEYEGSIKPLDSQYPGDEFVDWTCLDGFNWGTHPAGFAPGWTPFTYLFDASYELITDSIAPGKPMLIETATSESGGSKAMWITRMFNQLLLHYPYVKALLWFDRYDGGMDWEIETSPAARVAFAAGIGSPRFAANLFRDLATDRIAPLAPLDCPLRHC